MVACKKKMEGQKEGTATVNADKGDELDELRFCGYYTGKRRERGTTKLGCQFGLLPPYE